MTEILSSIAIWAGIFALERAIQRRGIMQGYEIVSSTNAIVAACMGLVGVGRLIEGVGIDAAYYSTVLNYVIGYFIIDSIKIIMERKYLFILHHVIALLLCYNSTINSIPVLDVILSITEISTPFLHYMTWARRRQNTIRVETVFLLLFFVIRCLLLPWAVNRYWQEMNWTRIPYSVLVGLNMYWLTRIIRMVRYRRNN
jgi:hypothetical protein